MREHSHVIERSGVFSKSRVVWRKLERFVEADTILEIHDDLGKSPVIEIDLRILRKDQ
jgi:hypothetical protein